MLVPSVIRIIALPWLLASSTLVAVIIAPGMSVPLTGGMVSWLIAAVNSCVLLVSVCAIVGYPLKATTPIAVLASRLLMNSLLRFFAASKRVGWMSVAVIDALTSIAST